MPRRTLVIRKRNRSAQNGTRIRKRRFAMTLNNPTDVECAQWLTVLTLGKDAPEASALTFFIVQTEKGDGTQGDSPVGTVHYQAYCEFNKAISLSGLKKIFGNRVHVGSAIAGPAANIRYCSKNRTRFVGGVTCISGQWGHPKRGAGLMQVAVRCQNGASLEDIDSTNPDLVMMHGSKIEAYIARQKGRRKAKPKIIILYGLTGCGKSQYCVNAWPGLNTYWVSPPDGGRVWFGGYHAQSVCIFDDFNDDWFKLEHMLHFFDSTPLLVSPKGGQVEFNSETLVLSSNVDPRDWYSGYGSKPSEKKEHRDALARRINDFAEIFDCTLAEEGTLGPGPCVMVFHREKRTEVFEFRDDFGDNFTVAGTGDLETGNGFGY